jgi:transcriptional regulator with GAF, ATPase, and Fis domain
MLQVPLSDLQERMNDEDGMMNQEHQAHPSYLIPPPSKTLADAEREHILDAFRETGWVLSGPRGAAARLGVKRGTLQNKMRKLGIARPP